MNGNTCNCVFKLSMTSLFDLGIAMPKWICLFLLVRTAIALSENNIPYLLECWDIFLSIGLLLILCYCIFHIVSRSTLSQQHGISFSDIEAFVTLFTFTVAAAVLNRMYLTYLDTAHMIGWLMCGWLPDRDSHLFSTLDAPFVWALHYFCL
jgi:hypothetical protein